MAGLSARLTPARLVASGGGTGWLRPAPGTWGSLAALLAGAGLMQGPAWLLPAGVLAAALGGLWAIPRAGVTGDPGWVVIDEVAGQWLTLLGLGRASLAGLACAFALFRLLDVTKPGPIGWADRRPGALGIMGDDLIAGAIAAALLWAARRLLGWPG